MNAVLSTQVSLFHVIESSDHSVSNHPSLFRDLRFGFESQTYRIRPILTGGYPFGT